MKAISLKQPWSSLIAPGHKTIEARTWPTKYRGDLLICSSKKPKVPADLPTGKALAVARLIDCRRMTKADEKEAMCERYNGAWAWLLADIRKIMPFDVKGRLGLYEVESVPGLCRVCGCTDYDCSQCIAATGQACHWVEPDLCSRCK